MKKNGFISVIAIVVLVMIAVVGYFSFKYAFLSRQTEMLTKQVVIPNVIDQWIPKVKWDETIVSTDFSNVKNTNVEGVSRKGTILNPDKDGNPYAVEDLLPDIDKRLENLGWKSSLPIGASGPTIRLSTYYKDTNMLKVGIEVNPEVKCPCVNTITVFQEK